MTPEGGEPLRVPETAPDRGADNNGEQPKPQKAHEA
jgi:hypothetical protein